MTSDVKSDVTSERTGTRVCPSSSESPARSRPVSSSGFSLVEVLLVCAVIGSVLGLGLPSLLQAAQMKETTDAAAFLTGQFRMARQRAVMTGRHVAIVFDPAEEPAADSLGQNVEWRVCEDGNRDGVSRADIANGTDRCGSESEQLSRRFPHVTAGYQPGVPALGGGSAAPLRFGRARMAVFTAGGTASSGTIVLRGRGGTQVAVRVSGVTGRTRVLRFDRSRGRWPE